MSTSSEAKKNGSQATLAAGAKSRHRQIAYIALAVTRQNPAGSTLIDLIEAATAQSDEVTVFSSELDDGLKDKVRFYPVPILRHVGIPGSLISFHIVQLVVFLAVRIRHGAKFDVIHVLDSESLLGDHVTFHNCCAEYLRVLYKGRLWSPIHNLTSVLANCGLLLNLGFRTMVEFINCHRAERIYALTSRHKEMLVANYRCDSSKIAVLPNYIQKHLRHGFADGGAARRRIRQGLHLTDNDFLVLFVGQGAWPRKGLRTLLEAIQILNGDAKAFLLVLGQGSRSEASWFRTFGNRLGLAERVFWLGFQREVFEYYLAADCFVLPSHHELFSLATLEALAAGLPLLLSDTSGSEEVLIPSGNGFIVKIDPCDLAAKLKMLLEDRGLSRRFAIRSSELAISWTGESYCQTMLEFYDHPRINSAHV